MNKKHCDFCDDVLGEDVTIWSTLKTPNVFWEFCSAHDVIVTEFLAETKSKIKSSIKVNTKK